MKKPAQRPKPKAIDNPYAPTTTVGASPPITDQLELSLGKGVVLREQGMNLAAMNNKEKLDIAREVAVEIAREKGEVTSDDVRYHLNLKPSDRRDRQNWMGSIFRDRRFSYTGRRIKSKIARNHAAEIKVWCRNREEVDAHAI